MGGISDALRVSEDAHHIVPQAGELGAVMGIREDLGTALGWGVQVEGSQTVSAREGSSGRTVECVQVELARPREIWAWRDMVGNNGAAGTHRLWEGAGEREPGLVRATPKRGGGGQEM